jgi:hypothetical protein
MSVVWSSSDEEAPRARLVHRWNTACSGRGMHSSRLLFAALGALGAIVLGACSQGGYAEVVPVSNLPQPDQDAIRSASNTVAAGGTVLSLKVLAWRNGMPGSDDNGLMLNTAVIATSGTWPAQVTLVKPFVVRGTDVWDADYTDESPPTESGRVERIARRGPDWRTPSVVDIIVRLDDGAGHTLYLAQRGVPIETPE